MMNISPHASCFRRQIDRPLLDPTAWCCSVGPNRESAVQTCTVHSTYIPHRRSIQSQCTPYEVLRTHPCTPYLFLALTPLRADNGAKMAVLFLPLRNCFSSQYPSRPFMVRHSLFSSSSSTPDVGDFRAAPQGPVGLVDSIPYTAIHNIIRGL